MNALLLYSLHDVAIKKDFEKRIKFLPDFGNIEIETSFAVEEFVPEVKLCTTKVVFLLMSSNVCLSQWWNKGALEYLSAEDFLFIPIVVKPCEWESCYTANLPDYSFNEKPLIFVDNLEQAWTNIFSELNVIINKPQGLGA